MQSLRTRRSRHSKGKRPQLGSNTFVAPNASVVGDVKLGNNSSIWYGAVLRGEIDMQAPCTPPVWPAHAMTCTDCCYLLEQSPSLLPRNNLLIAGDVNSIEIGSNSNIQDGATVHVARHNPQGNIVPTIIGNNVTIGEVSRHTFHALYAGHDLVSAVKVESCGKAMD